MNHKDPPKDVEVPAPVVLRMEELSAWTAERVAKMTRDHRFTIGDRLIEACLEVTLLLYEAAYRRDRVPLLQAASRGLLRARVLVRLGQRLRLLSMSQREYFAKESTEIGQMIGGWTKASKARYEGGADKRLAGLVGMLRARWLLEQQQC